MHYNAVRRLQQQRSFNGPSKATAPSLFVLAYGHSIARVLRHHPTNQPSNHPTIGNPTYVHIRVSWPSLFSSPVVLQHPQLSFFHVPPPRLLARLLRTPLSLPLLFHTCLSQDTSKTRLPRALARRAEGKQSELRSACILYPRFKATTTTHSLHVRVCMKKAPPP